MAKMLQLFFFIEILMFVTSIENFRSQDDNLYSTTRPNIEVGSDPSRTGGILHFGKTTENRLQQEIANLERKINHMKETMSATTTTTTTTPKPPLHAPGKYKGCYRNGFFISAFKNRLYLENNTIDGCNDICYSTGFKFSATEYGNICYCSNNLPIWTCIHGKRPESYCDMSCPGNSNQICGGFLAMSIYETSTN